MRAPSCTVDPLPINASSPITHPCTTHRCPMVAPAPISVTGSSPPCSTQPSWTFAPARTTIGPKSARSTALYQIDASASTRTSPTRVAVGAMNAVGCTVGAWPSKENSGMRALSHVGGEIDHRTHPVGDHACMTQLGRWAVAVALVAATVTGCAQVEEPVGRKGATPAPAASDERALPVYYVAETAAGPRLQREFHRLAAADPGTAAVREMLARPTGTDPDYRNPWPAGTTLRGPVASTADASTVALTAAPPSDTAPPIPRGDPYALRSLVQIAAPADGTSAASPVTVTGEAAVFEATLHWTVLSGATTVRSGVTPTAEGQTFAPFRFSLDLPPGRYTVRISEDDPSDGAGRPVLTDDRTVTVT